MSDPSLALLSEPNEKDKSESNALRRETDQTETNVDSGIIYAKNRKFEYRGVWAQLIAKSSSSTLLEDEGEGPIYEVTDDEEEIHEEIEDEQCETDIYPLRLAALKGMLTSNLKSKWPNVPIVPIKEACNHIFEFFDHDIWVSGGINSETYMSSEDCQVIALIGVLRTFKLQEEKHTAEQFHKLRMTYVPSRRPTEGKLETIQLLDDDGEEGVFLMLQRSNKILDATKIITGVPCAVTGFVVKGSRFVVSDVIYATPRPCIWPRTGKKIEMVFVSGLSFGDGVQETSIEVDLLSDYLLGLCSCPNELENYVKPKTKVFFVGNSFAQICDHFDEPSENEIRQLHTAGSELDSFFANIATILEVILIPGPTDPTEKVLPQKPFDASFFPLLYQQKFCKSFHDPCRVQVSGISEEDNKLDIILSSGSNIDLVKRYKYLTEESTLFIAQKMLEWGHINPAAKDFFPLNSDDDSVKEDLFTIRDSLPHLYVIGNQKQFMVREFNNTKIVCLPSFAEAHQAAALVRSGNDGEYKYDITPIHFGVS